MIPDSTLIASCTVPDSLNSKKSARGVVENRIDPETVIIKTGSEKISVKVPEEKLQAGDTVVMKFKKGYVLLEKVQMPQQQPPGTPDSFSSARITYSDQHLSAALDSAIRQLKSGEKEQFVSQRIISVLNALESNASGKEKEAIQKASAALENFVKSPVEVKNRSQELINLLESVKKEIAQKTPVRELEKLIFIDIPDKQIPEGLYKLSSKEEIASFLQTKAGGGPHSLSPEQQNKELYIRTFPSGSGTTAILLDKGSLRGEIQSWSRGFSSSIMQSVPAQVYEQLLESRESIELAALHRIDAVLQSARYSLPQTRAGSQSAQAASVAQWLNTALENTEILDEISVRPPVNASTVAVQLEEINAAVVKNALPSLTQPEQFGVTEDNLDKNMSRAGFLTKLMQKAGIDFENSISENRLNSIKEPSLKYSLLSLMNAVNVPAKNSEGIRSDIIELQEKIDSIRASISTHLQAAADENPEIQTERVAVILAKAVYIAQMLQTSTENPQAAPGETAKDSRFAATLSFLLKDISNSLEKKTLPEFTNPEQVKATGSRSDFLAKLLAFLGIDVDRKNAGEGTAQDAPSPDFSERAHPLPGSESFRPAEISQETPRQAAPSRSFTETQFDSNEQIQTNRAIKGDPETFTDKDLKEIQNRLDSLRRSVEALRETQTEDFEAQTEKKGAVVAKAISAAQWFTDSEIADQLQSDKSRSATVVPVLNVLLKEISKSLQTESLPEFTNSHSFRAAVERADKNRLDLLAMLLEKSETDSHYKPGTLFSSQKQVTDLADTLLSFFTSGRSGVPSGSSSEISASEQSYFKSTATLSADRLPPEDIDELQVRTESLKKSVQELLEFSESQDADVKQKLKSEIVEKSLQFAKWFTSTDNPGHSEENRSQTESTASVLNTLLKETISSIDKKVIPEFVTDRSVKAASESPDIKTRMDLLFRLFEKSGSGKEGTAAVSAQKQAVLDLTNTIVSFLNSGRSLPVQEKIGGNAPAVTTQRAPDEVNRISREELKEISSKLEDLRNSLKALIEKNDTDTPEIRISAKADVLGKVLSVASAISKSAENVYPDDTNKIDVSTRSVFSSLLREIVSALDKKALPEFTSQEFTSTVSEVSDEKIRDEFLAKFLQKIGFMADQKNPAASGTVKIQSSSDLPELLLSILSERKDILPQQRDPGSTKQVSADAFKDETIRAQSQFSLPEKRVLQAEIKELQTRIESLRKSIENLMQVQDSKSPEVRLSKGTDVLQKAVSVAQWFNESSYEKQVKTDTPVKNSPSASALSSILDEIKVSLEKNTLPEFTKSEFIRALHKNEDTASRADLLTKFLEKTGNYLEKASDVAQAGNKRSPDLTAAVISILSQQELERDISKQATPESAIKENPDTQPDQVAIEKELKARLESLKKEIDFQLKALENQSRQKPQENFSDISRTLSTLPEKLGKLLSTFVSQSPEASLAGNLSQAIIEELLSEKSVSGFSNLALKSLVIPEDSTLSLKIKNLALTALGSQINPGTQSLQELLNFLNGNLKPQVSILSGLLDEVVKSASGIKPDMPLFSFIKKETSETLQTYLTKVVNWFAEKSSNVLRSDFSGMSQFPAEQKIFNGSTPSGTGPAPSFPFDKAGLIKTASDILGILHGLEESLTKVPFSSRTQLKDTTFDQNLFTDQKTTINERQTRAGLKTAENVPRVIGQSVMKALSEIKDLLKSTIPETAASEKSSNQASGSAEKKTGSAGDEPLQKFVIKSRSELANRTENILNRVSGELENTLKRVNETFERFSGTAKKGQPGAASQIPVLIEKAIDEIVKNLHDLKDSLRDSSLSPLSKEIAKAELLRKSDSPLETSPERDFSGEAESFSSKVQIRQSVESLLNRLESLQLLARQTQTPSGDQQIVALPMKIGGEWTEVNVRFVKKNQGRDKKGNQNHFSVYLNVSPSQLGAISIQMEYERKKSLYLDVEFEKKETRIWFSKNSDDLRRSLAKLDLPMAQMVIHQVRAGQKNETVQEIDGAIDMKV